MNERLENSRSKTLDPIVILPEGFDLEAAWKECEPFHKILAQDSMNIGAAFCADPGICSCTACHVHYWAWGQWQRCSECGFEYPTNSWGMYSWGVQATRRKEKNERWEVLHAKRMTHPYYRYGYKNPVECAWEEFHKINWREALKGETDKPCIW